MSGRTHAPVRVVSIHDVAPATREACGHLLSLCEESGVLVTLLVIPGPWRGSRTLDDRAFADWLLAARDRGHEVSLHGWCHEGGVVSGLADRVLARGCGEFAHLSRAEARRRLESGLEVMDRIGVTPVGFTAPGWLCSEGSKQALIDLGFAYTTSHLSVIDLARSSTMPAPALCQRPGSTITSLGIRVVRRTLVGRVARGKSVRLALHPDDLSTEPLVEATRMLIQVMATGSTSTYADLVTDIEVATA
ncbi:MAG: hypothetical protein RIR49_2220 [Actinomycetota bacterium]|jgi:predicted deacetylase